MQQYFDKALELAAQRRGFCAPNPAVGAVLVKDNQVIATGMHWAAGQPHAEIVALKQAGDAAQGADLYITLEPCCHWGKTPPCTQAIIAAGVARVFFAMLDPNDKVAGNGQAGLLQAGIDCQFIPVPEIEAFYQSYRFWMSQKQPWVTAKLALSADGKIAGPGGERVAITGAECAILTHQWRYLSDAILTTVRTIIQDDPAFNVRADVLNMEQDIAKPLYVLGRQATLPLTAKVLTTAQSVTIFYDKGAVEIENIAALEKISVRCIAIPAGLGGLSLSAALSVIAEDGCHDVWLEAGGLCFSAFYQQGLMQRALMYHANVQLGEAAVPAFTIPVDLEADATQISWQTLGDDRVCQMELL